MEKLLSKLARQLDSLDEASLMGLWSKYAVLTSRFEPTARWEQACLIFSLIQAKHWKNQLFNYCWVQQRKPPSRNTGENRVPEVDFELEEMPEAEEFTGAPCRVLQFRPRPDSSVPKESE